MHVDPLNNTNAEDFISQAVADCKNTTHEILKSAGAFAKDSVLHGLSVSETKGP